MLEVIKAKVSKNRTLNLDKTEWGVQKENNIIQLQFEFPEELNEYNKSILFEFDDDKTSFRDFIFNNLYNVKNNITKHLKFDIQIVFESENGDKCFKTKKRTINISKAIVTEDNPPTPEQLSEWNTLVTVLNDSIEEVDNLKEGIDNIAITASKSESKTTVTITNEKGVSESFEVLDGKDGKDGENGIDGRDGSDGKDGKDGENYILTNEDKEEISKLTQPLVEESIKPILESNLQQSKQYADSIKPTKTSELVNDSNFAKTNTNNNFSTSQTINGTLTINGNIVQNGEQYETHAEQVFTKDDEIITRDGAVGGLPEGQYTGIRAKKYDGTNDGRLGFNAKGEARVGDIGDEQPLLTRDEVENLLPGQVLVWDGTNLKAVGSSEFVKNTDYANSGKPGLVRVTDKYGTTVVNGTIRIIKAENTDIDDRTDEYRPIVPVNLDYAVGSVKASETQSGTIKAWTSTNEYGEIGLNISTEA